MGSQNTLAAAVTAFLLAFVSPANAVPITVLAVGSGNSSGPASVEFTINYAAGLPGDVQTIRSITFDLTTPGHDTNAYFQNNAVVLLNPYNIQHSFDYANVRAGILRVNFGSLYFDSGESFKFKVGVGALCAGCGTLGLLLNSGGAIGFNEVAVAIDIAGASVHSGDFSYNGSPTTSQVTINAVPEPSTLLLVGAGLFRLLPQMRNWRPRS